MSLQIQLRLKGAVRRDDEADVWVGYCPTIKVYSQGTSEDEAEEALKDAAASFVIVCLQQKILERTLESRGFMPCKMTPDELKGTGPTADEAIEYIAVRHYGDEFEFNVTVPYTSALAHAACQ